MIYDNLLDFMPYVEEVMGDNSFEVTHKNNREVSKALAILINKADLRPEQLRYYVGLFCSCNRSKFFALRTLIKIKENTLTPAELLQLITTAVFVDTATSKAYYVEDGLVIALKTKNYPNVNAFMGVELTEVEKAISENYQVIQNKKKEAEKARKQPILINTAAGNIDIDELYDIVLPNYKRSTFKIYLKDARYNFISLYRASKPTAFSNKQAAAKYGIEQ